MSSRTPEVRVPQVEYHWHRLYSLPCIVWMFKLVTARLAEHIACTWEMRNTYVIFISKSDGEERHVRNHRRRRGEGARRGLFQDAVSVRLQTK
jgi:hypothetical protein